MFDHLRVALYLADQRVEAGQAQADDLLPVFHRRAGAAAGVRGLTGIAGHLLDGRLQLAQGVANLCRITGLALGTGMQAAAQLRQGAAAAGDLFGVLADGPHQIHQVGAQAVQRGFDIVQFAIGLAQLDIPAEVAFGPGRQGRGEVGQDPRQLALQGVDQQGDKQDQADHHALHQAYFTLDLAVLGPHHRLQRGDGLLHGTDLQVGRGCQVGPALDLFASAGQFGRVAGQQAVQFALEVDAGVHGRGFLAAFQAHHGTEVVGVGFAARGHAQQGQGFQLSGLAADTGQLALDIGGQFTATAADQFVPGQ